MRRPGIDECIVNRRQGVPVAVKFPAQFPDIGKPQGPHRVTGDGHASNRHPWKGGVVECTAGDCSQDVARPRTLEGESRPCGRPVDDRDAPADRQLVKQTLFLSGRGNEQEAFGRHPDDDEFGLDATGRIQNVGKDDAAVPAWQAVGDQTIEPGRRRAARHLDPGEGGDVHETCPGGDRPHLCGHEAVDNGTTKGMVIRRGRTSGGKPAGSFVTGNLLEDGPGFDVPIMDRRGPDRASRRAC